MPLDAYPNPTEPPENTSRVCVQLQEVKTHDVWHQAIVAVRVRHEEADGGEQGGNVHRRGPRALCAQEAQQVGRGVQYGDGRRKYANRDYDACWMENKNIHKSMTSRIHLKVLTACEVRRGTTDTKYGVPSSAAAKYERSDPPVRKYRKTPTGLGELPPVSLRTLAMIPD